MNGAYNALDGLLLSRGCGAGRSVYTIDFMRFVDGLLWQARKQAALIWFMALCLQWTEDRPASEKMVGRSTFALPRMFLRT